MVMNQLQQVNFLLCVESTLSSLNKSVEEVQLFTVCGLFKIMKVEMSHGDDVIIHVSSGYV